MSKGTPGTEPRWLRRVPTVAVGVILGVLVTVAVSLLELARGDFDWAGALLRLGTMSLGYTGIVWWLRRRVAIPGVSVADRAVRAGRLPPDADPADLRHGLLHVKRGFAIWRRWTIGVFAVTAVLWATFLEPAVVGGAVWWLVLVGCGASAVGADAFARARSRRVDRLLAELAERPPEFTGR